MKEPNAVEIVEIKTEPKTYEVRGYWDGTNRAGENVFFQTRAAAKAFAANHNPKLIVCIRPNHSMEYNPEYDEYANY